MRFARFICVSGLAAAVAAPALAARAPVRAMQGWSRPAAAGQVGVGYMILENPSSVADRLTGADSPVAARVELHRSMVMNGVAMMHPVEGGAQVPARSRLALEPGGLHLMLVGLKRPLRLGERVPVTLRLARAGRVSATLEVRAAAPK